MNSLIVLKNVTSSTVTTPGEIENIAAGELVAIGDGRVVLTGAEGEAQDIKYVQFYTRKDDGSILSTVPILRRAIDKVNWQIYKAPVIGVYSIGSTSAAVLPYDSTVVKEYALTMHNLSYNNVIDTNTFNVSLSNRIGETKDEFYTRLVAKINNTTPNQATRYFTPFYTAALSGTTPNKLITFTMANSNIDFRLSLSEALAGVPVVTVTPPQPGVGVGTDVLAMEKDYQSNLGRQGFVENSDLWFTASLDTVAAGTYSSVTLQWTSENDSPTVKRWGARLTCGIFYPSAATTLQTNIANLMKAIFGDAWAAQTANNSAEPGANLPDNDAFDKTVTEGIPTP